MRQWRRRFSLKDFSSREWREREREKKKNDFTHKTLDKQQRG